MQQNLFGEWAIVRVHEGRVRAAVMIVTLVESREVGERLVRQICGVRARHGYEPDRGDRDERTVAGMALTLL